jgi:hypothetical protein
MRKIVGCRRCGAECFWDTNRHGKKYLAEVNEQQYDGGTGKWKQPHYCQATDAEAAKYQEGLQRLKDEQALRKQIALENGEIVVGQIVKVYRGRKVRLGTIGIVFWLSEEADGFGCYKVGFTDKAGNKHFTAINNVDFYFDGADALNEQRVAEAKAEAKARRKMKKEFEASGEEVEI